MLFLLCSQYRLSVVSVVFDFNASLSDVAPVSPILLSVDFMRMEEWIVDGCHLCVCFLFSQLRLSFVSVLFDFSASLHDAAPLSLILLSVGIIHIIGETVVAFKTCVNIMKSDTPNPLFCKGQCSSKGKFSSSLICPRFALRQTS